LPMECHQGIPLLLGVYLPLMLAVIVGEKSDCTNLNLAVDSGDSVDTLGTLKCTTNLFCCGLHVMVNLPSISFSCFQNSSWKLRRPSNYHVVIRSVRKTVVSARAHNDTCFKLHLCNHIIVVTGASELRKTIQRSRKLRRDYHPNGDR
jgi:hypothetical protein